MDRAALEAGTRVVFPDQKEYIVKEMIACGGFSIIYRVIENNERQTPFVMKEIFPEKGYQRDETFKKLLTFWSTILIFWNENLALCFRQNR